ncbi:MAG: hypothetical protein QS748_14485 [Candidatus Endonucleobacter bathymodioli]|uniref:Uncharacterized protein n=1 Tax=Candidatus Endonucleibacter bathymodioli TaxID=539814 RepID=A0AA90P3B7_9GAMM|nr:hypothetical protein [Candidatus Endonucleobacter bathymodioli]
MWFVCSIYKIYNRAYNRACGRIYRHIDISILGSVSEPTEPTEPTVKPAILIIVGVSAAVGAVSSASYCYFHNHKRHHVGVSSCSGHSALPTEDDNKPNGKDDQEGGESMGMIEFSTTAESL